MTLRTIWKAIAGPSRAILTGLAVLYLGLTLTGYDGAGAMRALASGGFGSRDAVLSALLPRMVPILLIGLGIGLAFQAGALNIGAEGQFYAGAIAATWVGLALGGIPSLVAVPTVLLAGVLAGSAWAAIPAFLRLRFGVLEVISTLLLNFVAEAMVSWAVQGPLQESGHIYPQSDQLPLTARLPGLPGTRLHLGLALGLVLALALHLFYRRTLPGFQLRATGANATAAEITGGVRTRRVFALALMVSGGLAGMAGATEVSGTTFALFQNLSPGYGFTGIAVALLARLDPLATVVTAGLFAAIEAGASAMQREAGVPAAAVYVVEATITISVLLADAGRRRVSAKAS